jgi:hypothetical protein
LKTCPPNLEEYLIADLDGACSRDDPKGRLTRGRLEGFPDLAHDDEADACSGAHEMLNPQTKGWGQSEVMRRQAAGETLEQIAGNAPTTPEAEKTPSLQDIYLAARQKYDGR